MSIRDSHIMCALNLPPARLQLRDGGGGVTEVYDPLRRKWLVLTPEEWVRQHFAAYMQSALGVPPAMMANELTITLNDMTRRCDTVVFSSALRPIAIVEYKAPGVKITEAVFRQICSYNLVLRVPLIIVSNGLSHYCCRFDATTGSYSFLEQLPAYVEMLQLAESKAI